MGGALDAPVSEYEPPSQNVGPLTDVLKGVSAYNGILTGDLGFSTIRSTMLWEKVEKEVGIYNFVTAQVGDGARYPGHDERGQEGERVATKSA